MTKSKKNDWPFKPSMPFRDGNKMLVGWLDHPRAFVHEANNAVEVVIMKTAQGEWFIVNDDHVFDDRFEERGPFNSQDEAVVTLKLIADFLPED